jgi:hypothetical protein
MIVPEIPDLSWSWNSTSLQSAKICSSMVTMKSYGSTAKNLLEIYCLNLEFCLNII